MRALALGGGGLRLGVVQRGVQVGDVEAVELQAEAVGGGYRVGFGLIALAAPAFACTLATLAAPEVLEGPRLVAMAEEQVREG